jgi:hypothetical protein
MEGREKHKRKVWVPIRVYRVQLERLCQVGGGSSCWLEEWPSMTSSDKVAWVACENLNTGSRQFNIPISKRKKRRKATLQEKIPTRKWGKKPRIWRLLYQIRATVGQCQVMLYLIQAIQHLCHGRCAMKRVPGNLEKGWRWVRHDINKN